MLTGGNSGVEYVAFSILIISVKRNHRIRIVTTEGESITLACHRRDIANFHSRDFRTARTKRSDEAIAFDGALALSAGEVENFVNEAKAQGETP